MVAPTLGREARPPRDRKRRSIAGQYFERAPGAGGGVLADALRAAQIATHKGGHHRGEEDYVADGRRHPFAGINAPIGWRTALPDLIGADGRPSGTPQVTRTDETATLRTATIRSSACLAAGTHLLEIPEGELVDMVDGKPVLDDQLAGFDLIRPAPFAPVELTGDEGEVALSDSPIARAQIDRAATEQLAVRFEILRSTLRTNGPDRIESQLLRAIPAGLGVALDGLMLRALSAATADASGDPPTVVHEICGRAGLRWAELACIVGQNSWAAETHGTTLHVSGIHAEHSAGAPHTIVGAWDRCAIAASPEIEVLIERRDASGKLVVTAWCDAQALVPDASYFEEIGADPLA